MKKFQFSLKAVLSYREHLEQIAKQELAEVIAEINHVNAFIEEIREASVMARDELQERSEKGISANEMNMYMDYLAGMEQQTLEAKDYLQKLHKLEDKKRFMLAKKSVEKKVIVNLKDRRKKEYVSEMEKLLQQQSDEMVLLSGPFTKDKGGFVKSGKE